MNRPRSHPEGCHCNGCTIGGGAQIGRVVFNPDDRPRWAKALLDSPVLTGVVTYKGVNADEIIAAAQAVIEERDRFSGDDKLDTIDDVLNKLRKALPQ